MGKNTEVQSVLNAGLPDGDTRSTLIPLPSSFILHPMTLSPEGGRVHPRINQCSEYVRLSSTVGPISAVYKDGLKVIDRWQDMALA